MFPWSKKRHRRKIREQFFPKEWDATLRENVWQYSCIRREMHKKYHDDLRIILDEKEWEGCGGLQMNDKVKVTIAGQAAILLLGIEEEFYFDQVKSVLVYPDAFSVPEQFQDQSGVVDPDQTASGEAFQSGPVVLSWDSVLEGGCDPYNGHNVVIHEFAHQLDALSGEMGGMPPIFDEEEAQQWVEVFEREFQRLEKAVQEEQPTLLDEYGATNRAEFFAVATECFFEQSETLLELHSELYGTLKSFYRQDPAQWMQ